MSADSSISLASTRYSAGPGKDASVSVSPGLDWFVVRGFSIGADLTLAYAYSSRQSAGAVSETTTTTFGGGPRFGFNVPLGASFSFYPRVTVGLQSSKVERKTSDTRETIGPTISVFGQPTETSATVTNAYVVLFTPVLFHPVPHFFVGAGPGMYAALGSSASDGERTAFFGRLVVGGWWGGADEPATPARNEAAPPEEALPRPRAPSFGDSGTWLFTGALGANVARSSFNASNRSSTSYSVSPAVDYFFANHFSVGLAAAAAHSSVESPAVAPATTRQDSTAFSGAAVLGFDQPLASWLSVYPRASVAVGHTSFSTTRALDAANSATTNVTVALYVPLLVHVATHAFVGFGPSVTHDLMNRFDQNDVSNLRTTVGGHLVIGGWLSR